VQTESSEVVSGELVAESPGQNIAAITTPATLLAMAVQQGASMETLERLMDLQDRWEKREAEKAFNEAMAAFKLIPIKIIKRKLVDFATQKGRTTYKHAELDDVVSAVGPELAKQGFSWSWDTKQKDGVIEVTCKLRHRMGHSESVTLTARADETGGKNAIQAIVSTTTYLQRHTLKQVSGTSEAGEDVDGQVPEEDFADEEIPPELLQAARDASMNGWKAFAVWIKSRTEDERALLDPEADNRKAAAKAADAKAAK